jgi:hypothetical protein
MALDVRFFIINRWGIKLCSCFDLKKSRILKTVLFDINFYAKLQLAKANQLISFKILKSNYRFGNNKRLIKYLLKASG